MQYEGERGWSRDSGRWEPANDGEHRRWHGDEGGERHFGHGRGRGRGHFVRPGFPPGPGFAGPEMHFGPMLREPRGMRGPRARRGDVRAAALALLSEAPMNGYQIIQEITNRSGGVWRPSPGSVYPALQQLEDEGLIKVEAGEGGRRAYQLTEEGQQYVGTHQAELRAPWDVVAGSAGGAAIEMRHLIGQVAMAAVQVVSAGTEAQAAQARQLLTDTRKALYRILAADDDSTGDSA
jgi:DNA-binding PadR family transcriptional regulator